MVTLYISVCHLPELVDSKIKRYLPLQLALRPTIAVKCSQFLRSLEFGQCSGEQHLGAGRIEGICILSLPNKPSLAKVCRALGTQIELLVCSIRQNRSDLHSSCFPHSLYHLLAGAYAEILMASQDTGLLLMPPFSSRGDGKYCPHCVQSWRLLFARPAVSFGCTPGRESK